jgi:energy-coupling factor transport system ATP-binding protein
MKLRDEGMTILLVTRELDDFILTAADQLIILDDGKIMATGAVQKVLAENGPEMLDRLGIWLPETVEIGIKLRETLKLKDLPIPISIAETLELLEAQRLLKKRITNCESEVENMEDEVLTPLITGRNLEFSYNNGFKALNDVSFEVYPGEMLAIVGRNGAGKSTLAKLMVGLQKPQQGQLTLFNHPAKYWKVEALAEHIALVFQNPEHQFLTDTTYDEIAYSLMTRGIVDTEEVHKQVEEWMIKLELSDFSKIHPFALSAGKKRRLGVATMLVCHPKVLLVDEPTYGQDKEMTQTLMQLMERIREQGVTVVMITHDMRLVQEFASRVLVMAEGKILYEGDPAQLFENEELLHAANLRPTLLQELLKEYQDRGGRVDCLIRNTDQFLEALNYTLNLEDDHVG